MTPRMSVAKLPDTEHSIRSGRPGRRTGCDTAQINGQREEEGIQRVPRRPRPHGIRQVARTFHNVANEPLRLRPGRPSQTTQQVARSRASKETNQRTAQQVRHQLTTRPNGARTDPKPPRFLDVMGVSPIVRWLGRLVVHVGLRRRRRSGLPALNWNPAGSTSLACRPLSDKQNPTKLSLGPAGPPRRL